LLPKPTDATLSFFLDEGIPDSIGELLEQRGHVVTYGNRTLLRSAEDQVVCSAALTADAILVAADHDMKRIARDHGVQGGRFKSLSLIKLSCRAPDAATKVEEALSLIEHEWLCGDGRNGRRIWFELQPKVIRIVRDT
jgi:predicted nuclease of predicted toxin-antitoxin system